MKDLRTRSFVAALAVLFTVGTLARTLWLTADPPPSNNSPGIVWHDEGAWVHNARNRALFGEWRTDEWNPVFIAPVFTALEYGAFRAFGVGTWQARTVPVASGLAMLVALIAGLTIVAGRRAALAGGAVAAVSYFLVMWNRAALMESTMTACIVIAWAAYAGAQRRAWWGLVAGASAVAAYFTKAYAAFFVVALGADALIALVRAHAPASRRWLGEPEPGEGRAAAWTLGGLAAAGGAIAAVFVLPHWVEYHHYNVTVALDRKPEYTIAALVDRMSLLSIDKDVFGSIWPVVALAAAGVIGLLARWRVASPGQRLLAWWVLLGLAELIAYDVSNDRRFVAIVPALIAIAAVVVTHDAPVLPRAMRRWPAPARLGLCLMAAYLTYLVAGSVIRMAVLDDVHARHFRMTVRLSAGVAVAVTLALGIWWRRFTDWASTRRLPALLGAGLLVGVIVADASAFAGWAGTRTDLNYRASIALGERLAPGTLVQGKLANGLSLENRIRPLFIGNHFGNFDDRLRRDDVRYILTYIVPSTGYESGEHASLIPELLAAYPKATVVAVFDVRETTGPARAALFEKHARD